MCSHHAAIMLHLCRIFGLGAGQSWPWKAYKKRQNSEPHTALYGLQFLKG